MHGRKVNDHAAVSLTAAFVSQLGIYGIFPGVVSVGVGRHALMPPRAARRKHAMKL
jgi:hypothetical protein